MKLIIGLGNPGPRYANTRHNVGFAVVNSIASRHSLKVTKQSYQSLIGSGRIASEQVWLQQPLTYMNLSGQAVAGAVKALGVDFANILVVVDDLDLPFGIIRIRAEGGSGGHRGLKSIIECLGTTAFPRLRIGIGRPVHDISIEDYVLQTWSSGERGELPKVLERAVDVVECFLCDGVTIAANRYN